MRSNNNGSRAAPARGFMALFAVMLAMGLGLMPVEAAPFAYVTNDGAGTVSVIDTATNMVVATLPVGDESHPIAVAVAPDGKHAYVADFNLGAVSVIDTGKNTVVATVPFGGPGPSGVAVTPDGKNVYVTNAFSNTVSVIETTGNTVVATVTVGSSSAAVAVTPDGKHAYVANGSNNVAVIATATNTVVTTLTVGADPEGVAVTPDGKHAYVTNRGSNNVSIIDTATNTVESATLAVGTGPTGVAVTPDGKHAYVTSGSAVFVIDTATNTEVATIPGGGFGIAITPDGKHVYVANENQGPNNVSVIDTATNTVVATVLVGNSPSGVGIIPDVPFLAFGANLVLAFGGGAPNQDSFALQSRFILSSTAPAINPLIQPVTLQAGTFAVTIPPGSFVETKQGFFVYAGLINGATLEAAIEHTGTLQYAFQAKAVRASFTGTMSPVYVTLTIGGDSGATSVTALIFH